MSLSATIPPPCLHVLLPPAPDGADGRSLHTFAPVAESIERTKFYRDGHKGSGSSLVVDSHIVVDGELQGDVLELAVHGGGLPGRSAQAPTLEIPCRTSLPIFVAQLGELGKHVEVAICVETVTPWKSALQQRSLIFSTRCSVLTSRSSSKNAEGTLGGKDGSVTIPLSLSLGWNRVELDLSRAVALAWGELERYVGSTSVSVTGSVRVARIYFADRDISNGVLPEWLQQAPLWQ